MYAAFYKGVRPGINGIYNLLIKGWTRGKYSHVEIVFSDGTSASSSFLDGGVRFKYIDFSGGNWDLLKLDQFDELSARRWFAQHDGQRYDLFGVGRFIVGFVGETKKRWFCSEAVAEALGFKDSWRFEPNILAAVLTKNN